MNVLRSLPGSIQDLAEIIQLAVAPIFLLSAVATTLLVFSGRLARVVDRGRFLEKLPPPHGPNRAGEMTALKKRARLIYWALSLGAGSALCVCTLMTVVFMSSIFDWNAAKAVALLFLLALFSFTGALFCLLQEVFLAVGSFNLGLQEAAKE